MFEKDKEMSLSPEDLFMTILCLVVLILAFSDTRGGNSVAFASFPAMGILFVCWGIVRFRRRPLPKQVHFKRMIYLSTVKVLRNFHLISAGFSYLYILFRYSNYQQEDFLIALIFNFVGVFAISIVEIGGHILVNDDFVEMIKLEDEDEKLLKKKRFDLLFGTRFYILISIFSVISLGVTYFSVASLITSKDLFLILMQFVYLIIAIGLYLYTFNKTMRFGRITNASLLLQAVDYYETVDLLDEGFKIIEEYIEEDPDNIALLSKLALLHTKKGNYDETMKYAGKVLAEIEEKNYDAPHMTARAHMLRAVCLNAKERYEEAYKEVTQTLKYTPENNAARKLRRDLRRNLKQTDSK